MNKTALLSPSLLSANLACLGEEMGRLAKAGIKWAHLDVMDGQFVPNITYGAPVIAALRKGSQLFFDAHLMIENPELRIDDFQKAGVDLLVVHLETTSHPQKLLAGIRELGIRAGIALNPGSDFLSLRWLLPVIDLILVMGVNPGFSGQKFIPETTSKVAALRRFLVEQGKGEIPIQVDGGVNLENAAELVAAGANILVSGSAFFRNPDYAAAREEFDNVMGQAQLELFSEKALNEVLAWQPREANP